MRQQMIRGINVLVDWVEYMAAIVRIMSLGGIAILAFTSGMLISALQYDLTAFADMLTMLGLCLATTIAISHVSEGASWHAIVAYGLSIGMYIMWLSPAVTESVALSFFNLAVIAMAYSIWRSKHETY